MSELNASNLRKEHGNEGPDLVGVTELTSPYYMVPPSGTTAERPQNPQKGTLRFNTDIGSLEYFKGDTLGWESINRTTPNLGGGTGSNTGTGARGVYGPGEAPAGDSMDYITISTLGNSVDFGDIASGTRYAISCWASPTRGLMTGGASSNIIEYLTIATLGNTADFGDLTVGVNNQASASNTVRGITSSGTSPTF